MAQVYACFHDGKGNILVTKKNLKGYFFHNKNKPGGTIIPNGQPLNGGGDYCLSGGGLEVLDPIDGALKEFLEETNVAVNPAIYKPSPEYYHAGEGSNEFYGVYFLAPNGLDEITKAVIGNLLKGAEAANAVKGGYKGSYDQLREDFKYCPSDNELNSGCAIVNFGDIPKYFVKGSRTTGWYYDIVMNLIKVSAQTR